MENEWPKPSTLWYSSTQSHQSVTILVILTLQALYKKVCKPIYIKTWDAVVTQLCQHFDARDIELMRQFFGCMCVVLCCSVTCSVSLSG